jgi:hypothetical protein
MAQRRACDRILKFDHLVCQKAGNELKISLHSFRIYLHVFRVVHDGTIP